MAAQLIVVCALVAIASAGHVVGPQGGQSTSSRKQDDYGNYAFNYQIVNGAGAANGRWEAGNGHGGVVGSYNIKDIDGRARTVDYVADKAGFRAKIKTNEPGTAASLPAAAVYDSPYHGHVAHGVAHGPVVAKAAFVAPIVAKPVIGYGGYGHGYGLGHGYGGGYGHGYGLGHGYGGFGHGGYGHGYGLGHGYGGYGHGFGGYGKGYGY